MKAQVVIGSNFGDEGKGLMVDYLASKSYDSLTVRFNGGANAGHTVETEDGNRHVFGSIGSGSFCGSETLLSEYFVINPSLFRKEYEELSKKIDIPNIYYMYNCKITTPYDVMINQIAEDFRSEDKHGSCGVGLGETEERNLNPSFRLDATDICSKLKVKDILKRIHSQYLDKRLISLGVPESFFKKSEIYNIPYAMIEERFIEDIEFFKDKSWMSDGYMDRPNYKDIIFEGAQGLLLDQTNGTFPNVTRSNTGIINASDVAHKMGIDELDINYMTRCYMTRHGAGVFDHNESVFENFIIEDKTNVPNKYQDSMRFDFLDINSLYRRIELDLCYINRYIKKININLGVTCIDQIIGAMKYKFKGEIIESSLDDFFNNLRGRFFTFNNIYESYGPTRKTMIQN